MITFILVILLICGLLSLMFYNLNKYHIKLVREFTPIALKMESDYNYIITLLNSCSNEAQFKMIQKWGGNVLLNYTRAYNIYCSTSDDLSRIREYNRIIEGPTHRKCNMLLDKVFVNVT